MKHIEITFTKDGWHRVNVSPGGPTGQNKPKFTFKNDEGAFPAAFESVQVVQKDGTNHTALFGLSSRGDNYYPLTAELSVEYTGTEPVIFEFVPFPYLNEPPSIGTIQVP
jgi:hypothetical protein